MNKNTKKALLGAAQAQANELIERRVKVDILESDVKRLEGQLAEAKSKLGIESAGSITDFNTTIDLLVLCELELSSNESYRHTIDTLGLTQTDENALVLKKVVKEIVDTYNERKPAPTNFGLLL